jgi:hypothetical protein
MQGIYIKVKNYCYNFWPPFQNWLGKAMMEVIMDKLFPFVQQLLLEVLSFSGYKQLIWTSKASRSICS